LTFAKTNEMINEEIPRLVNLAVNQDREIALTNVPGIEAHDAYSIVDKPNTSLIYLNNKEEKRVMYLAEIVKFCDATLERVLKEVKLKIFKYGPWKKPPLMGEFDLDILKAYEREITNRLRHRVKMRNNASGYFSAATYFRGVADWYQEPRKMPTTRQAMSSKPIKELIAQRMHEVLVTYKANQNNGNGNGHGNGNGSHSDRGSGNRRTMHTAPYDMSWKDPMKMMTEVYYPRNEIQNLENELWNLTIKCINVMGYTQRFQELALLCPKMVPDEEEKIERTMAVGNKRILNCYYCWFKLQLLVGVTAAAQD
ncbi:mutator type transposase, partial [Tanacetum coccineum]